MSTRVLLVCSDDTYLAPMAGALLRRHLERNGLSAHVASAGVAAVGESVADAAVNSMAAYGIDIAGHRPRTVTPALLAGDGSDLVITLARAQLRHVVALDRRCWVRTFTVKELVRIAPDGGPPPGSRIATWASNLVAHRRAADLVDDAPIDDIPPATAATVSAAAAELHDLMAALATSVPWR